MDQAILEIDGHTAVILSQLKDYFGERTEADVLPTALTLAKIVMDSAGAEKTCTLVGKDSRKTILDLHRR
ncbi:MAG: hypothetical protein ACR2P3_12770 [Geminicoccaceae bacterium]